MRHRRTDHQTSPRRSYRHDEEFCDMQRFGIEHSPHFYRFAFADSAGHRHAGSYYCTGLDDNHAGHPFPERPRRRSGLEELLGLLGDVKIAFWICPDGHSDTFSNPDRRGAITVEWVDGIAHCTQPGCHQTSAHESG